MVGGKCISTSSVQSKIGCNACKCMPIVHSFSGCDTTSAVLCYGNGSVFSKIAKGVALTVEGQQLRAQCYKQC